MKYRLIIHFKTGKVETTDHENLTLLRRYLSKQDNIDRHTIIAQDGSIMEES